MPLDLADKAALALQKDDEEFYSKQRNIDYDADDSPTGKAHTDSVSSPEQKNDISYKGSTLKLPEGAKGGKASFFNDHAVFTLVNNESEKLESYKDGSKVTESGNGYIWYDEFNHIAPTARNIIEEFNTQNKQAPYKISDFLYCRDYGVIPNNYMVTLRRYPEPITDNMQIFTSSDADKAHKLVYPIATSVAWMTDDAENNFNELSKFSVGMNWGDLVSDNHKVVNEQHIGATGAMFSNALTRAGEAATEFENREANFDPTEGSLMNTTIGPINVINTTKTRDRGLTFDQSFEVTFNYSLRSIGKTNPKAAMLDILANMLSLTYNFAEFWGGSYRYFAGEKPHLALPGGMASLDKLRKGIADQTTFDDLIKFATSTVAKGVGIGKGISDKFGKVMESLGKGNFSKEEITNALTGKLKESSGKKATAEIQKAAFGTIVKLLGLGDIPALMAMPPLLTGNPIGEWHLMVGNPFNPTMMIGNLICNGMDVEFGNKFGIDGFPEEMKFTVRLEHGRPRDAGDIQSMFNRGNGRTYYLKDAKSNNSSSTQNSDIDEYDSARALAAEQQLHLGDESNINGTPAS